MKAESQGLSIINELRQGKSKWALYTLATVNVIFKVFKVFFQSYQKYFQIVWFSLQNVNPF